MSAREKGMPSKDSVSLLPCFYFVELPILVSSMVSLYFLEWTDLFKPVKSGFNCHDRSLSLPYVDPNHEVVPLPVLLSLAFAGPAITMMIGEAVLFCCLSGRRSGGGGGGGGGEANLNAAGCHFNSFIRRAIRFVGVHAFGLCATALITDLLQLMTGYPAPYFLTVCKPNYTALSVSCEQNPYVMEEICSGVDAAAINRGRKSFPSQHATLASFAAVYVSMYFNSTLTDSSKLLKPLLVFSFIIGAIVCGLTRIIQYKNHAVDVYLGFLLGGAIAVYLGLYAVGNFLPGEEMSGGGGDGGGGGGLPAQPHCPTCSLAHISQEAVLHQLQLKAGTEPGTVPSEGLLRRALPQQRADDGPKRSGGDGDGMAPRGPRAKETVVTFSHTLPRVHTPQAIAAYEEAARRHAATLHRDSARSKQLLSQWKSQNNHKCPPPGDVAGQPAQHPRHHEGSPDAAFEAHAFLAKLAAGASATLPGNCSGIAGGARMLMQSRPGSSQLVHIPEESQENERNASPRAAGAGGASDGLSPADPPAQTHWQRVAEMSADQGKKSQPRMVQVMALCKQQALLQAHSRSLDESSTGGASQGYPPAPCADKEPGGGGGCGAIVRIEAHPDNHKPIIQAPSTDGSGSWRWRSLDHAGNPLRQSFDLGDPGRDSESSDSPREGSLDGKRAHGGNAPAPHPGRPEQKLHHQSLSTIRVTPGDAGGGGDGASEIPSLASSRESTLRRKGHSVILIPERGNSPESTRNVFYKGASGPHPE